jgi:diguanylate cyclase (GGDEF)-like protein
VSIFAAVNLDVALVFFDLDGFTQINDEQGHQAGDECLNPFAAALRAADEAMCRAKAESVAAV